MPGLLCAGDEAVEEDDGFLEGFICSGTPSTAGRSVGAGGTRCLAVHRTQYASLLHHVCHSQDQSDEGQLSWVGLRCKVP